MTALVAATAMVGAIGVSAASAATVAARTDAPVLDGQLMVAHGDSFDGGAMVMQTQLRTASGVVPLTVPASDHSQTLALAGQHVQVTGSHLSRSFAVSTLAGTASANSTAHVASVTPHMRIAVVLMRLPGSSDEPVTKASATASTFGATKSVANWFSQMSGGQVSVTGKVYGYYTGVNTCDLASQLAAGAAAAAKNGYVASDYDHLVVYTPAQPCDFSGIGWVGQNGVFLNGTMLPGVMEHELGHNLGLMHSGEYACGAAPASGKCLIQYGDDTDVMGNPYYNRGYNGQHKYALGWIPADEVRTVTSGTETVALTASENPLVAGSTELIHVRAADGAMYAIDRRASVGYDTGLSGVWVRRIATASSDDTELVRSSALAAGSKYTDPVHHITVETLTDSGPTASVRVCVGPCDTTETSTGTGHNPASAITARNIATGAKSAVKNSSIKLTVPAGRAVAAGHTVVVSTYISRTKGAVSCRDSRGNAYSVTVNSVGAQHLVVCSAHVSRALVAGGTITMSYPGFSGSVVTSAVDFAGLAAAPRVDRKSADSGDGGEVNSKATAKTTKAAELVFGVVVYRGASAFTATSGYARVGTAGFSAGSARMTIAPEFKIVSAKASYNLHGTLSSARPWRAAVVTFFAS